MIFRSRALAVLLVAGWAVTARAQIYTESKRIARSFPAHEETRLDVTNKYGKIQVIPWKKDSVRIEIDLSVTSNSMSKVEKLHENIDFDFTGTRYYIIARTSFGNKYNSFFNDLKELSESLIPSKNRVEIDYTIRLPSSMSANISNRYGDLYLDDMKGTVNISLSNGDLKANRLEGQANINLNFGNGTINYYQSGRLTLSYADVEVKEAGRLDVDSKSSTLRVNSGDILNLQSRRDKITASSINNIFGDAYFSEIWVTTLSEEVNLTPRYGDFRIDHVGEGFTYISLNSEYTDIDLMFSRGAGYSLDILYNRESIVRLPENNSRIEVVEKTGEYVRINGSVGSVNDARVKIIAPKKCVISLHER